jgi:hypothetical protein
MTKLLVFDSDAWPDDVYKVLDDRTQTRAITRCTQGHTYGDRHGHRDRAKARERERERRAEAKPVKVSFDILDCCYIFFPTEY